LLAIIGSILVLLLFMPPPSSPRHRR
jgi:hypothetical protein